MRWNSEHGVPQFLYTQNEIRPGSITEIVEKIKWVTIEKNLGKVPSTQESFDKWLFCVCVVNKNSFLFHIVSNHD